MKPRSARRLAALAIALPAALWPLTAPARPDGAPPGHTGGFDEPSCAACHTGALDDEPPRLVVTWAPSTFRPGEIIRIEILLAHPQLERGGFQLAMRFADGSRAGTLRALRQSRVQVTRAGGIDYAGHRLAGSRAADGRMRWILDWIAPVASRPVHLSAAANAADDDASPLGDSSITVQQVLRPSVTPAGQTPPRHR